MERSRKAIVNIARQTGLKLNETYAKFFKYKTIKLWKYSKTSKSKARPKIINLMKTRLGRLIRTVEKHIEEKNIFLDPVLDNHLKKSNMIFNQTIWDKAKKAKYKETNKVLYSFHAPEVECIGKGKLNKPYEFGNKVAVAVSGQKNFVLAVKSFHENPYDGHTLLEPE